MLEELPPNWGLIVEQNAEQVLRIALRILGSVHDAEDVCQIVFVEAISLQRDTNVRNWTAILVRLVTLRSIDILRQRRHTMELSEADWVSNIGPVDEAIGAEMASWLRSAVGQLPEQQALIFTLCCFENLDRNQVAELLRITPESVSTALCKARHRLMTRITVINEGC